MKRKSFNLTATILFLVLNVTFGQTAPELGSTAGFALFTANGAFNELGTSSTVTGDVSTNVGAFAAFPPGTLHGNKYLPGSPEAALAATDVAIAYSDLNQGGTVINTVLDGLTLTSGVYNTGAASSMGANGILTLNGQGNPEAIFIIRIGGAFATGSNTTILLTNSASTANVFWQINGQFDLGINSTFRGTAIVNGAINLLESSTLYGRALSIAGAISLHNNIVTIPSHFRSRISGNWNAIETWESSTDSISWSNAFEVPTANAISVNISNGHTVTITSDATASVLTINPGSHLTLNAAQSLTADIFIISSDITNGAGTYVTNGTTTATISRVKQQLTTGRNWYVSSPVEAATASSINTSSGSYMVGYDETHGSTVPWPTAGSTLNPLKGYIVISPVNLNPTITFTGVLNDGTQTIPLSRTVGQTKEGFNLIGNPYPSHITWTQTIATNANAMPTIWYRTYVGSVYAFHTFNLEGGVGVPANTTGVIPPAQAFWVRVNSGGGTVTLNNSDRMHDLSSNRLKAPAAVNVNQIARLLVSNDINSNETVVYFNENAEVGFDDYDSPMMSNNNISIPEIFTMAGSEKVIINGFPNIVIDDEIPLGFMTLSTNEFSIRANEFSNFPSEIKLMLIDKLENATFDLTTGEAYNFSSDIANSVDRFSIIFRSNSTTTGKDIEQMSNKTLVFRNLNNQIVIICNNELTENPTVTVFNSTGQQIAHQQIINNTTILNQSFETGIYVVEVNFKEHSISKKLVL